MRLSDVLGLNGLSEAYREKRILVMVIGAILVAIMFIAFRLAFGTNIVTSQGDIAIPVLGTIVIIGMAVAFAHLPVALLGINDFYKKIALRIFLLIYFVVIIFAFPAVTIGFHGALIVSILATMGWGIFQGYAAVPRERKGIKKLIPPFYTLVMLGLFVYYVMHIGSEPNPITYTLGAGISFILFIRALGMQIERMTKASVRVLKKEERGIGALMPNVYIGGFTFLSLIIWAYLCNFITVNAFNSITNSLGSAFSYCMQLIGAFVAWIAKPKLPEIKISTREKERADQSSGESVSVASPVEPISDDDLRKPTLLDEEDLDI